MNYNTILFDIDDTLLDFKADEEQALARLFALTPITLTPEVKAKYSKFNQNLWQKLEQGEITREKLLSTRFNIFFKQEFDLDISDLNLANRYLEFLSEGHDEMQHAHQLITSLAQNPNLRLAIATNGARATQVKRLRDADLIEYFDRLFISEEMNANKPQVEFFNYIENHLENYDSYQTLIVGDSLTSDIQGGNNAHVTTVWYNPNHQSNSGTAKPDYEIDDLLDLQKII